MSNKLKGCPFCGIDPNSDGIHRPDCYFRRSTDTEGEADIKWNNRPIEDALQADKDALEAEILNLHKAIRDLADMEFRPGLKFRNCFPELCDKIDKIYGG